MDTTEFLFSDLVSVTTGVDRELYTDAPSEVLNSLSRKLAVETSCSELIWFLPLAWTFVGSGVEILLFESLSCPILAMPFLSLRELELLLSRRESLLSRSEFFLSRSESFLVRSDVRSESCRSRIGIESRLSWFTLAAGAGDIDLGLSLGTNFTLNSLP